MEAQKMTLHRALSELKTIDFRINKKIENLDPIVILQKDKLVRGYIMKSDFESNAKAEFQSITDLIERKNKIKAAILNANFKTEVKIGNKTMTISEVIVFRSVITLKRELLNKLKYQAKITKKDLLNQNEQVEATALNNAKIILGKQGDDRVKATDKDVKNITKPFIDRNKYSLIDPLEIDKEIKSLEEEIETFETEIDAVLSEINAITIIEV